MALFAPSSILFGSSPLKFLQAPPLSKGLDLLLIQLTLNEKVSFWITPPPMDLHPHSIRNEESADFPDSSSCTAADC